jgi:hypothetical protein
MTTRSKKSQEQNSPKEASEGNGQAAETPTVGKRISELIKLIKPYRDLLALLVSVVIAISAVTSWITTKVATRAQVGHLECRTSDYIYNAVKPVKSGLGRILADWDIKEAMRLMEDPKQNPAALRLMDEARSARAKQDKDDDDADAKYKLDTANCDRGPSQKWLRTNESASRNSCYSENLFLCLCPVRQRV